MVATMKYYGFWPYTLSLNLVGQWHLRTYATLDCQIGQDRCSALGTTLKSTSRQERPGWPSGQCRLNTSPLGWSELELHGTPSLFVASVATTRGENSLVCPTSTTRDWAFYDNFDMTKHFLVIETTRLWQFFNRWQAFVTKLCFGHKQPSPCALPNLCDNSSWRKWSKIIVIN